MKVELEELIDKLSSGHKISDLLPKAILIAKKLNQKELIKWLKLELHGYFSTNPEMTDKDEVPQYRTVAGIYYDKFGNPLILNDPKYSFINETRLRNSISEIEALGKESTGFIQIINYDASYLLKQYFNIEIQCFKFPVAALKNILDRVRMETLERMLSLEIAASSQNTPKSKKAFIGNLNALIIENRLKEALELAEHETQGDSKLQKEVILQKARLNELEKQERLGTVKPEEIEIQYPSGQGHLVAEYQVA